ncbi:MAG: hypothetical protein ABR575_02230 [Actinomycetota bacterium]
MGIRRAVSDFRQLRASFGELLAAEPAEEERARWQLAQSAHRFSRRTRAVVDDKLSLSATLMRAGEVHEASRLLVEVETDVRTEEAALIESVNEVKVARAVHKERMTRMRMARLLAVSLLGASVLGFSAIGVSLAAMFDDDGPGRSGFAPASAGRVAANGSSDQRRSAATRSHVRVAGVDLKLTRAELKEYRALTAGTVDRAELAEFLYGLLPMALADKVTSVLTTALPAPKPVQEVLKVVKKKKKAAAEEHQPPPAPEPPPEPEPEPQPPPEPEPEPSEDPEDGGGDGGGDQEGPGAEPEGNDNASPLPLSPR